ncbi:MAG: hypothetical protein M1438_01160 [Deltaproteobacteria bacterium]|nr:hypothetical protein [Deltaproteobacteria bacterium]
MSERLQNEGRLAETRVKIKELKLRLENLRDSLRRELDQFEPLENLKGEVVSSLALDFAARQGDYLELLATEKAICQALGK